MRKPNLDKYYWTDGFVQLRLATVDDWEEHFYNYYDSENRFLLNLEVELPPDIERSKEIWTNFVSPKATHGRTVFAIENQDGKTVGTMNMNSVDERNGTFSVGIQINTDDRGKGYGTAALRMVLGYAFKERRLHKCNSGYLEGNKASTIMHEKLGFKIEGIIREVVFHDGKYYNEVRCGITEQEFYANQADSQKK